MSAPHTKIIADTGATDHFIDSRSSHLPTQSITPTNPSIPVLLPNGQFMHSQATTNLPVPNLPRQATKAHVFSSLASGSLLSVGKMCDENCTAVFLTSSSQQLMISQRPSLRPTFPPSFPLTEPNQEKC